MFRSMDLLSRLKDDTRSAHDRIEKEFDLLNRKMSLSDYRGVLARLFGFIMPWERAVSAQVADPAFFEPRRKLQLLERDLDSLGMGRAERAALPLCAALPAVTTPQQAFGSMYVVEGSTLGGRYIARHLEACLGTASTGALNYFESYGAERGRMWNEFRARLAALAGPAADDAIIAAALQTFERMRSWLVEGR